MPEAFDRRVCEVGCDDPAPPSVRGDPFLASTAETAALGQFTLASATCGVPDLDTVLDLGRDWGAALAPLAAAFPEARVVGGERSASGVELARELHAEHDRIAVERFDLDSSWMRRRAPCPCSPAGC